MSKPTYPDDNIQHQNAQLRKSKKTRNKRMNMQNLTELA